MNPRHHKINTTICQRGIGMIEVLVTVFILAIGLLGIAGTQFMSKRANFEAAQRTTATLLANDILERMRANSAVNPAGLSMLPEYVAIGASLGAGTATAPPVPTAGDNQAIMLRDLWEWEQAIIGASETKDTGGPQAELTGGLVSPTACLYTTVPIGSLTQSGQYMVAIVWRGTAKLTDPVNPVVPAPAPDPYACGRASGNYDNNDDPDNPVVNAHRRVLVVTTYIGE